MTARPGGSPRGQSKGASPKGVGKGAGKGAGGVQGPGDAAGGPAVGATTDAVVVGAGIAGLALFYGGRAAELAARGRSLVPRDVAEQFAAAFDDPGPDRSSLDLPFVLFDQPPRW